MTQADDDDAASPPLSVRLSRLYETFRDPHGRRYSDEHISRSVQEAGGPTISPNYLYLLRTGKRDNPTKRHLEAIARFFDVSPAYFFDDELSARIREELELLVALRDSGVRAVAMRAAELSPRSRTSMLAILSQLRQIEIEEDGGVETDDDPPRP